MNLPTILLLLCVFAIVGILYLVITHKGDFEAGGRVGPYEFFLKAKEPKESPRRKRNSLGPGNP